jgi:hypothetical protein
MILGFTRANRLGFCTGLENQSCPEPLDSESFRRCADGLTSRVISTEQGLTSTKENIYDAESDTQYGSSWKWLNIVNPAS